MCVKALKGVRSAFASFCFGYVYRIKRKIQAHFALFTEYTQALGVLIKLFRVLQESREI